MLCYIKQFVNLNEREAFFQTLTSDHCGSSRTSDTKSPTINKWSSIKTIQLQKTSAEEKEIQEDSKEDSIEQIPGSPKVQSARRSPRPQQSRHPPDRLIVNSKLRRYQEIN